MSPNLTTGLVGATALVAGVAIGYLLIQQPTVTGSPYPSSADCNSVAGNSSAAYSQTYHVTLTPATGSPVTAAINFDWGTGPGYHHNVLVSGAHGSQWMDIVADPCTVNSRTPISVTFNLHPETSQGSGSPKMSDGNQWRFDQAAAGSSYAYTVTDVTQGLNNPVVARGATGHATIP